MEQHKEWEKRLDEFQELVQKNMEAMKNCKADLDALRTSFDLEEMRKCKAEMYQMRNQMAELVNSGRYIRDDQRLILSAPEIIIGNVDSFGVLKDHAESKIILRGTQVSAQAVGEKGEVEVRASRIREVAEDPGIDGCEHVMRPKSDIISQARHIVIETNENCEFSESFFDSEDIGINIVSDSSVNVGALQRYERKGSEYYLTEQRELVYEASRRKDAFKEAVHEVNLLVELKKQLLKNEDDVRINYQKLDRINERINYEMKDLAEKAYGYYMSLSELAENNRLQNLLEYIEASSHVEEEDFKKYSTGTSVNIASEQITLTSVDGDHNLRDNPGAGINMKANQIKMEACESDGKLKENGYVNIKAKGIDMVTAGRSDIEYKDDSTLKAYTNAAEGNVRIQSKNIILESVDYEMSDDFLKEKQLTPNSNIKLRSKNIEVSTMNVANVEVDENGYMSKANYTADGDVAILSKRLAVSSTDYDFENGEVKNRELTKGSQIYVCTEKTELSSTRADGNAAGSFVVNAKDITIKSMDVKADDRTDDLIAYDGTLSLAANKINMYTEESLQLQSQKIGLFADETVEAQQGHGESAVQLSNGDVLLGGSKNQVVGNTEINGEFKVPKAIIDNMEVKTSLKTPNITDGMSVPGPSAGNLSTKLEKEDVKDIISKMQTESMDEDSLDPFCEE